MPYSHTYPPRQGLKARQLVIVLSERVPPKPQSMMFRVSGRGRPSAPAGRRRRRMAVARLGDAAGHDAPRRGGGRLLALGRFVLPRLRLGALLLRSRRALARLRDYYADVVRGLVADAAAAEPVKAGKMAEAGRGGTVAVAARPAVVPAAVAGAVLRCNSHYYIR